MKREVHHPSRAECKRTTPGKFRAVAWGLPKRKRRPESDAEKLERIAAEALARRLEERTRSGE